MWHSPERGCYFFLISGLEIRENRRWIYAVGYTVHGSKSCCFLYASDKEVATSCKDIPLLLRFPNLRYFNLIFLIPAYMIRCSKKPLRMTKMTLVDKGSVYILPRITSRSDSTSISISFLALLLMRLCKGLR